MASWILWNIFANNGATTPIGSTAVRGDRVQEVPSCSTHLPPGRGRFCVIGSTLAPFSAGISRLQASAPDPSTRVTGVRARPASHPGHRGSVTTRDGGVPRSRDAIGRSDGLDGSARESGRASAGSRDAARLRFNSR